MTGQGDYLIVALPFNRDWMAWGGGLDKWGPLGEEQRFPTFEEATGCLEDARRDAEREEYRIGRTAVWIAKARLQLVVQTGCIYNGGQEITIDFRDDDLTPRQMRELGVL